MWSSLCHVSLTLSLSRARADRFFLFTKREPLDFDDPALGRDVFNEKPVVDEFLPEMGADSAKNNASGAAASKVAKSAVIFTTQGDIHVDLFPDQCPRTVENFVGHARNAYCG